MKRDFDLKKLATILAIFALLSCSEERPKVHDESISEAQVKSMYKTMCSICHGPDGTMGYAGAKDLSLSTMTLEERIAIIKYGKSTMLPFENRLTYKEIAAIAEYIDTFKK